MVSNTFIKASTLALCLALAGVGTQTAKADWIQDATLGGQKVFQAAFDGWTE